MAMSRASGVAPSRTRWMVAARRVVWLSSCSRASAVFTGLRNSRAANAESTASACVRSLEPKPPPTKAETTRTCATGTSSMAATSLAAQFGIWCEV
ncbi:hypothetical protein D9M72_602370 [compost metagenome]